MKNDKDIIQGKINFTLFIVLIVILGYHIIDIVNNHW
jgi:hypothetical protein